MWSWVPLILAQSLDSLAPGSLASATRWLVTRAVSDPVTAWQCQARPPSSAGTEHEITGKTIRTTALLGALCQLRSHGRGNQMQLLRAGPRGATSVAPQILLRCAWSLNSWLSPVDPRLWAQPEIQVHGSRIHPPIIKQAEEQLCALTSCTCLRTVRLLAPKGFTHCLLCLRGVPAARSQFWAAGSVSYLAYGKWPVTLLSPF